ADNPPAAPVSLMSRIKRRLKLSDTSKQKQPSKPDVDPVQVEQMLDDLFGTGENAAQHGIVIFDWVTLSSFHRLFAVTVREAALKRGYANLSLPHGDSPDWNEMFKMADIDYSAMEHYKDNPLDVVVVPTPLTAKRYTPFRADSQLKVIGSARYNTEWLNIMDTMIPPFEIAGAENHLKLVIFLRNSEFPINWEQVIYSIRLITQ